MAQLQELFLYSILSEIMRYDAVSVGSFTVMIITFCVIIIVVVCELTILL